MTERIFSNIGDTITGVRLIFEGRDSKKQKRPIMLTGGHRGVRTTLVRGRCWIDRAWEFVK